MVKYEITKEIQRLQFASSLDATKYNLTGVQFEDKIAIATDGDILAIRKTEETEPKNTNIQFNNATQFNSKGFGLELYQELGEKQLCGTINPKNTAINNGKIKFPDYRQVIDAEQGATASITIDINKLYQLCKALDERTGRTKLKNIGVGVTLQFDSKDQYKPVLASMNDQSIGFIIPMRLDDKTKAKNLYAEILDYK